MEMVTKKSMKEALVREAMSQKVISVAPQTSLKELMAAFEEHDFNMFPVIKDGKLAGVVTKLDLLRAFVVERSLTKTNSLNILADKVDDIMSTAVESVAPGDTIRQVVESMVENRLRSMPVVDGEELLGIISRGDVMRYLLFDEE